MESKVRRGEGEREGVRGKWQDGKGKREGEWGKRKWFV